MNDIENLQTEVTNNLVNAEELAITEEQLKPLEDTTHKQLSIILDRGVLED